MDSINPSAKSGHRVNALEQCMQKVLVTLDFLKERITKIEQNQDSYSKDNQLQHKEIIDKMDAWVDNNDTKYAQKWVEDEVYKIKDDREKRSYEWLKYVISAILGGLITYVVKNL